MAKKTAANTAARKTREKVEFANNSERFKHYALRRVNKALASIESCGNLANTANYEYTEEQAEKIISALKESVAAVENRFHGVKVGGRFSL